MVHRSDADRWAVISWHKEGLDVADIRHKTGFDRRFIHRWINKFNSEQEIKDAERKGRPRKRTTMIEGVIERTMRGKKRASSRIVARKLKKQKIADISYKTVQRAAHHRQLRAFRRAKSSRLKPKHKKDRLKFAKATKNKDWSVVVFSDEHKFKQFRGGNPAHNIVWAKSASEVPVKEVERWGMTVDAWAGISSRGKTDLFFYEGSLSAKEYQDIIDEALVPAAEEWFRNEEVGWELQQDKATCHMAKSTMTFLEQKGINVVEGWPTKGDDINPMENLWAIVDEKLEQKKFATKKSMQNSLREIWRQVDEGLLNRLIESVPSRLQRIIKAKGGSTKRLH